MTGLSRRRLLAAGATAALASLAGCTEEDLNRLNPLWDPPIKMKVIAASGDETDVTCTLDADAVAETPELERPLQKLADAADGERIVKGLTSDTGTEISNTLTQQCGEDVGGLYEYKEEWYLMGLTFEAQEDHQEHHEGQGGHGGNETDTSTGTDN